ncbi:MAG: SOS response-associated peptidase [Alphaproteobacteria bacterium]|nr:SOS response-associated peptidase [Alphaproteobacteria bacterium]
MCGLYSFRKSPEETRSLFNYVEQPNFPPRAHVAPGGPIAIVRQGAADEAQGQRHFALVRWGFVPSWAKELKPGKPLINARGETAAEKPTFRNAMKRRRCLIPADGFYEWLGDQPGKKVPYFIHRQDNGLFAFAGLWEHWMAPDGSELETAAIITTSPNREVGEIHNRMPVVIAPEDHETWLTGEIGDAQALIRPAPDGYFVLEPTVIPRGGAARPKSKPEEPPPPPQMKLI